MQSSAWSCAAALAAACAPAWPLVVDEAVSGDLKDYYGPAEARLLHPGINRVLGTFSVPEIGGVPDFDSFNFVVPDGHLLPTTTLTLRTTPPSPHLDFFWSLYRQGEQTFNIANADAEHDHTGPLFLNTGALPLVPGTYLLIQHGYGDVGYPGPFEAKYELIFEVRPGTCAKPGRLSTLLRKAFQG